MARPSQVYERQLSNYRKRIQQLPIPARNRQAIDAFADHCFSQGLTVRRVLKYMSNLKMIACWLHEEFGKVTRADIEKLVRKIERSDYAEWTKHDYRVVLKKFFKWLQGTEDYPPEVKWLSSTVKKERNRLPEELLTQDEVKRLIAAAATARDRALIAILYESGCRIGELLSLQIRQLQKHPHGFQITVRAARGARGSRRLLLITTTPYLTAWLNQHPRPKDPSAPLWPSFACRSTPLTHRRASDILKTTAQRAKVTKPVNPHSFRHARATHLANHLTEAQMNEYFGWVQGSDMPSTYVHLSGRDVDQALLRLHNIAVRDEADSGQKFSLLRCPVCALQNPPSNNFCTRCGTILDEKTAKETIQRHLRRRQADSALDWLLEDTEFRTLLDHKLRKYMKSQQ